jgi:UDP-N-acetylmuramate--alanine ligase
MLLDKVSIKNKRVLSKQELVEYVKNGSFEVFATIGAGDVDRMIPQLKQALEEC